MTDFESASLTVAIVVAVATCISAGAATVAAGGIWYGIRAMIRANKDRAGILDRQREADERRHDEAMTEGTRRHEEAMAALADPRRHEETMAALAQQRRDDERRHEETMAAFAQQHRDDERRHEETMAAFAQQHRDGERRHEEAMTEGTRRHEETMAALADQRRGLEALIGGLERQTASLEAVVERTAPKQGAAE